MEKLYAKNMEKIKSLSLDLYTKILNTNIDHLTVDVTKDNINILSNSVSLYPDNLNDSIKYQVASFLLDPAIFFHKPGYIETTHEFHTEISDKYIAKLQSKSPYNENINIKFDCYEAPKLDIPLVLMFGIGCGFHIIELLNSYKTIHKLILVDEDHSMLKLSFHLIDWTEIFDYFSQNNRQIVLLISNNHEALGASIINTIYAEYSFLFFYVQIYIHNNSDFFKNVIDFVKDKIYEGLKGWGFYDDSRISLMHTATNLSANYPIFFNNYPITIKNRVFLIGAGPSIDNDIDFIKSNQNNAILIACGSGLKVLEKNNIVPDYFFAVERNKEDYDILVKSSNKDYLKQISFIALNLIYPETMSLFKDAKIWFRNNDSGSYLTKDDIPKFDFTNPTVANGAFSFVANLGVKEIFLFGIDMGFKNIQEHHSKDSAYYAHNMQNPYTGVLKKVQANFIETNEIFTEYLLSWSKQRMENCIIELLSKKIHSKKVKIYNCSDGAFIQGTIPIRSTSIKLSKINKEKFKVAINKNFSKIEINHDLTSHLQLEIEKCKNIINQLINIFNQSHIESLNQMLMIMFNSNDLIKQFRNEQSIVYQILNGTIMMMFTTIYSHSIAFGENEESFKFINYSFSIIIEFLETVKTDLKNIELSHLTFAHKT